MKTDPILDPTLDRREFTLAAILAMLSGVTITISGCGGGSSPSTSTPPTTQPPAAGDKTATISADNQRVSKESSATSGHTHTVTFN
jgi:hypothetical protein